MVPELRRARRCRPRSGDRGRGRHRPGLDAQHGVLGRIAPDGAGHGAGQPRIPTPVIEMVELRSNTLSRRGLLGLMAVSLALPRLALAAAPTDNRLVVVILRGAMDGLAAVPPYGEKRY